MKWISWVVVVSAALAGATAARADDLTGAGRLLCSTVQVTVCHETGECEIDLPWNVNVPRFIEIDLVAKTLASTRASGENRSTVIEQIRRDDGLIVIQGFEAGRAFSFVIVEETGALSAAVAREAMSVTAFGSCTPLSASN